jgi:hypothetical protein
MRFNLLIEHQDEIQKCAQGNSVTAVGGMGDVLTGGASPPWQQIQCFKMARGRLA